MAILEMALASVWAFFRHGYIFLATRKSAASYNGVMEHH